jgi:hypothetical protein
MYFPSFCGGAGLVYNIIAEIYSGSELTNSFNTEVNRRTKRKSLKLGVAGRQCRFIKSCLIMRKMCKYI